MLADSMSTLNSPSPQGPVTTTFANAEKLVALGINLPAAAMVSGQGILGNEVLSVLLKKAGRALDQGKFNHNIAGVEAAVIDIIDAAYQPALHQFKVDTAAAWSERGAIDRVNESRRNRGLPDLAAIGPDRVKVENDPTSPTEVNDWDVSANFGLTVVIASFFADPSAVAVDWPGLRRTQIVPGPSPLTWWGSGGSSVSRIVRGFDMGILERLAASGDPDGAATLAVAIARPEFSMPTPISAMPLQDAIEFTEYLGQVSSGYDRFTAGPPGVGGPLDVLVLQQQSREWVYHKCIHSSLKMR